MLCLVCGCVPSASAVGAVEYLRTIDAGNAYDYDSHPIDRIATACDTIRDGCVAVRDIVSSLRWSEVSLSGALNARLNAPPYDLNESPDETFVAGSCDAVGRAVPAARDELASWDWSLQHIESPQWEDEDTCNGGKSLYDELTSGESLYDELTRMFGRGSPSVTGSVAAGA